MKENDIKKGYNGYLLSDSGKGKLLSIIQPVHPNTIAHHITYEFGVEESFPPNINKVKVIAHAENDKVQAAIVEVNGNTRRPDGKIYHITISIDRSKGGKPVQSNDLIEIPESWIKIDPLWIEVEPKFFQFK